MAKTPFDLKGRTVFVAGHRGMVGGALVRRLAQEGAEILTVARREVDLRDQAAVSGWFKAKRPQAVFLAAAKVGGIVANNTLRAEFIYDNLIIAANVIHAAHVNRRREADVPRLVLHLSEARSPAAARGFDADRTAGSRPTSPMRSPRSPASRWSRPIAASTAPTSSM